MILAAGEGTRLRPLTLARPKPMVPVAGRPVLEHIVLWLAHHGIRRVAINLHHLPGVITEHLGDGSSLDVSIRYSMEPNLLGTAGGARKMDFLAVGPWVVVYGDVLTDFDLRLLVAAHESCGAALSMALFHTMQPEACGIAEVNPDGRIRRFREKPAAGEMKGDLANAGILVVGPQALDFVPDDTFFDFGQDLIPSLLEGGIPVWGWVLPEGSFLLDVGTPEGLEAARNSWPTASARQFVGTAP